MSPDTTMSDSALSRSLQTPKVCDDGSNWADYEPRAQRALGSRELVPHLEGHARIPTPYNKENGVLVSAPGKLATESQVETQDKKIQEYKQHLILSLTSTHLSQKILQLTTAKAMWDVVMLDATKRSTFHQVDILTQLQTMKSPASTDPVVHLAEVKVHFVKMTEHFEYLRVTKAAVTNDAYITIIIMSMLDIYCSIVQAIKTNSQLSMTTVTPKALIGIFLWEVEHRVISNNQDKVADATMSTSQGQKKK
jgi:hypothetical protein